MTRSSATGTASVHLVGDEVAQLSSQVGADEVTNRRSNRASDYRNRNHSASDGCADRGPGIAADQRARGLSRHPPQGLAARG